MASPTRQMLEARKELMDTLLEGKNKTSAFCRKILGYEPYEYNIPYLDSTSQFIVYRSGRKVGKSRSTAAKALHFAWYAPFIDNLQESEANVILCAPTENQAKIIMRDVQNLARGSKYVKSYIETDNAHLMKIGWINGKGSTLIHTIPAGTQGISTRGFNPNRIIIDEGSWMREEVLVALVPSGLATNAHIWISTTPYGASGYIYDTCYHAHMLNKPLDNIHSTDPNSRWAQCNASTTMNPSVTEAYLEELKKFPKEKYMQEVEGVFVGSGFALIPRAFLTRAIRDFRLPSRVKFSLGVDPASVGNDETAFILIAYTETGRIYVMQMESMAISTQTEIATRINEYAKEYGDKLDRIYIDSTTYGRGVYEQVQESGTYCEGITFTSQSKAELYFHVLKVFEDNKVSLGDISLEEKLPHQLAYMRKEITESRNVKMTSSGHDDFADAFALAVKATDQSGSMDIMRNEDGSVFKFDDVFKGAYSTRREPKLPTVKDNPISIVSW